MTLPLTEDQRMLQDAAQRFLAERHPSSAARDAALRPLGARLALWGRKARLARWGPLARTA